MKRNIVALLLTMAMSLVIGTTAMAAGEINGFYDIESVQNVTITPKARDTIVQSHMVSRVLAHIKG